VLIYVEHQVGFLFFIKEVVTNNQFQQSICLIGLVHFTEFMLWIWEDIWFKDLRLLLLDLHWMDGSVHLFLNIDIGSNCNWAFQFNSISRNVCNPDWVHWILSISWSKIEFILLEIQHLLRGCDDYVHWHKEEEGEILHSQDHPQQLYSLEICESN